MKHRCLPSRSRDRPRECRSRLQHAALPDRVLLRRAVADRVDIRNAQPVQHLRVACGKVLETLFARALREQQHGAEYAGDADPYKKPAAADEDEEE